MSMLVAESESVDFEIDPHDLEICEKVGSGCTAIVYRGIYKGEEVAVKEIQFDKQQMKRKQRRAFDREIAIMKQVKHENLVCMFGIASKTKPLRIVTDYCAGRCCFDLFHNCDAVDLTWLQKFEIMINVAKAMEYLHKLNPQIIHRDLKSLNLLLTKEVLCSEDVPHVKISDFGLSRIKDTAPDAEWGKMTMAAGTCHWMAPEVFAGTRYDEKIDVYSYSMILFEVICRLIPFEDDEPADVARLACMGVRPDVAACPPDTPAPLRDLMIACWVHESDLRPSFSFIVQQLYDFAAHTTTISWNWRTREKSE
eukprot:GEMP01054983.1.p1 GENE.GEMP01054983.1~~GEMP01054983.1.p1  ORF type:complete len:310 (+),score=60.17 GEMP01054983.1:130-1059(+)